MIATLRRLGSRRLAIPLALFALALLIRLAYAWLWRFDGLYGQDAYAYFDHALAIRENLPRGQLPPRDFFWPVGYPALAALLMLLVGPNALAAQLASLICGAALAPLLYGLADELFADRRAGVLAGLSVAVASQPIVSSLVAMADMPALFWATLAAWLLVRSERAERPGRWLAGAGAALALAAITRWIYLGLAPAFGLYALGLVRRGRVGWTRLVPPLLTGLLIVGSQIMLSLGRPEGMAHSWLLGWRPANALRRSFATVDGLASYPLPNGLFYAQPIAHPSYLFPLLGLAALWAVWRLWRDRSAPALVLLLGWAGLVYGFLAGIPYQNFRFSLTLYPPLVLLAAAGASDLARRVRLAGLVRAGVALSLAATLAWSTRPVGRFLDVQAADKRSASLIEGRLPPGAPVVSFGLTLTLRHYTGLRIHELFYLDEAGLAGMLRCERTLYVVVDPANLAGQWRGTALQRSYDWLRANAALTALAALPPYTLFRADARGAEEPACASP
ncbi:MAG TPA: glycosyltransferase family 39 protein [Herpetosiphonaceae bacterium]|nr:glycosyltransferase family 39 protein [Herpetosiphonaceae bacterium]